MRVDLQTDRSGVARIVIDNRQRRNALTLPMWQELVENVHSLRADPEVRVVIVRGAGTEAFSSGADISEFDELRADPEGTRAYDTAIESAMRAVLDIEVPVIAQIHGVCVGGGVALALMCDLRYMETDGRIGIPAGKLGIAYHPEWIKRLVDVIGPSAASEIFFTAAMFSAERARTWGFATDLLPKGELGAHVAGVAERIASLAPLTLRAAKASIRQALEFESSRNWDLALRLAKACDTSNDYRRGVAAYHAKVPAAFEGN